MAVGYSYSLLGDLQAAKDTAQEAFIKAYYTLSTLREPAAFPGWFRRIVFQQIDRVKRGEQVMVVPLDWAVDLAAVEPNPADIAEARERQAAIFEAITALSEVQRQV